MTDNILSNPTITVNHKSLLELHQLLKKSSKLARCLFEYRIINFDERDTIHHYLWALSDGIVLAELELDALLNQKPMPNNELIHDSYRRLHHVLKTLTKLQRLTNQKTRCAEKIYKLKRQFAIPSKKK